MQLASMTIPYLLLVSFATTPLDGFGPEKIRELNLSPYHGVAVRLIHQYDATKYTLDDFQPHVSRLKMGSEKHIWPWMFFNRFIGYEEGHRAGSKDSSKPYFRNIKGMDLYNETGALQDFFDLWRISLQIARHLGSPGIVVDAEPYNNYSAYLVRYVSSAQGMPGDDVRSSLKAIGARLTDIVDEVYPEATLWFLFTAISARTITLKPVISWDYRAPAYIVMGMLERAAEKGSRLTLVAGGELAGYCFKNPDDLDQKIRERKKAFSYALEKYPNLRLGGTVAPWAEGSSRVGWMVNYLKCRESEFKNITDFRPVFELLMTSYDFMWIYAAGVAPYDPYDHDSASIYNPTLLEALLNAKIRRGKERGVECKGETLRYVLPIQRHESTAREE